MLNGVIPSSWSGYTHAALRIVTGLLYLQHGLAKAVSWPAIAGMPENPAFSFFWFLGAFEAIASILIIIGLKTRLVAFILSGEMAAAYFMAHAPQSFFPIQNMGESAILFCFVYLWLASVGAGPYSLDDSQAK